MAVARAQHGRGWQRHLVVLAITLLSAVVAPCSAQQPDSALRVRNDSVSIRLIDVDVRAAVQALAGYLDRPVVFGTVAPARVTLQTPSPVPKAEVLPLLRGVLESQNLELITEPDLYRVTAKEVPRTPASPALPVAQGPIQLFVIHLRHARAADVAATVNALYGRASALGEIGSRPSTLDQGLRQNQMPTVEATTASAAVAGSIAHAATLTGDVTIVPDAKGNSLLVRASQADFELIQSAVNQLDTRPLQALIEVLIVEARKDRSFDIGIDASTGPSPIHGTSATVQTTTSSGGGLTDFVLHVMKQSGVNIDATLHLAAERGDVSILSRPVVIASNNEEADILVGEQRPFVQVAQSLPTDNGVRNEVVQYRDVGTRLAVRPTISDDGYVMLQVTQEVNSATTETQFDAPVISTRTLQTQLLIHDGQTVVLGGLTDRERDDNRGGIPILSSIPILGGLFGHHNRDTTETELFLFITPHVIRTDEDADRLTAPARKRAEATQP